MAARVVPSARDGKKVMTARPHATDGVGARDALMRGHAPLIAGALGFGALVNLLMLTGPVFMLQIYDRVLATRSGATLAALFALVCFLYAMMWVLDHARGRVMARLGARFRARLDERVFAATMARAAQAPDDARACHAQNDLDTVQGQIGAPGAMALQDAPWTPLFIALIFLFHPQLGLLALAGGAVLLGLALLSQWRLRAPMAAAMQAATRAERLGARFRGEAGALRALGMLPGAQARWRRERAQALAMSITTTDRSGGYSTATRGFRLFLQSAMLALGAWLVLKDSITPGVMIAASIIMGRALAPVEQLVAQWPALQAGALSWRRLEAFLHSQPPQPEPMPLARPTGRLQLASVSVVPPGSRNLALYQIDMALEPGQALGVIGPSGSGKSTLARCITGTWKASAGRVTLDGMAIESYAPDVLGRLIGYLPQRVGLFAGTVAENIARLDPAPDPAQVLRAAQRAGVHEMIASLPQGYDTPLGDDGAPLSGGQIQRIGLARAFYGDPVLMVLDEPDASLDAEGSMALNRAIAEARAGGAAVMVMAHRPSAILQCDRLLVLDKGCQAGFGPRDAVLRAHVRNHTDIVPPTAGAASGAVPGSVARQQRQGFTVT